MLGAWIWPSSSGGVSHSTSIWILRESESSLAAASAPVREARKTGLFELLAIIAILRWPLVDAPGLGEQAESANRANRANGRCTGGRMVRVTPILVSREGRARPPRRASAGRRAACSSDRPPPRR